jgi:hypothetical protein
MKEIIFTRQSICNTTPVLLSRKYYVNDISLKFNYTSIYQITSSETIFENFHGEF